MMRSGGARGCKSCEAPIIWAVGPGGKNMPFNVPESGFAAKPTLKGDWVVMNGRAHRATDEDRRLHRELLTCHFATCPDANEHRSPR